MRAATPQLAARIAAETTTLCRLWRVTRSDGVVLRFTDAVRPVTIQIAPDATPKLYRADLSFTASAIFTSLTLANAQSVTLTVLLAQDVDAVNPVFVEKELRARLYDNASSELFICDYENISFGSVHMYDGICGAIQISDQKIATIEVVPTQSTFSGKTIGNEKYSQTCRASLGDARCKVDINALKATFTVSSASGGSLVSATLTQPSGHWALGFVKWLTGDNVGKTSQVQSNDQASTSLFLLGPPFFPIQVGDTAEVYPGCDKTRATCLAKFNNVVNMRAEPDVPAGALIGAVGG